MSKFLPFLTVLCAILMSSDAYAYLDPGTGSMVLQALVAGLLGSAFAIKTFWHRIRAFFKGNSADKDGTTPQ